VKQFLLNEKPDKNGIIRLDGKDYRYLVKVRRLAIGEYFSAVFPNGEEIQVQIISIDGKTLTGKCIISDSLNPSSPPASSASLRPCERNCDIPPIILFQSMPKGDKMDLIVRQAAEGGITAIVPFISEFSIGKANTGEQKFSRWEKIIKEARQQSGSKIATVLHKPLNTGELIDYWNKLKDKTKNTQGIIFHHIGLEQNSLHGYLNSNPNVVVLVIGPEGGFSEKEVTLFLENGFKPITIGDSVLRTETAALYCAAAIRVLLLEKNSWELKQTKTGSV